MKSSESVKPLRPKFPDESKKSQSTHTRSEESAGREDMLRAEFTFTDLLNIEWAVQEFVFDLADRLEHMQGLHEEMSKLLNKIKQKIKEEEAKP